MAITLNNIPLREEWRVTLQAYPTKSTLSLSNLWDLLYTNTGTLLVDAAVTDTINTSIGCKLEHDIICFSKNEYAGGKVNSQQLNFGQYSLDASSAYCLLGIDASIAKYDTRAKREELNLPDVVLTQNDNTCKGVFKDNTTLFREGKAYLNDKDSVLRPTNMTDFIQNGVITGDVSDIVAQNISGSDHYIMPVVGTLDNESVANANELVYPIYLNKVDTGFRGTLTVDNTINAYNLIMLNPYNNQWTPLLVLKSIYSYLQIDNTTNTGAMNAVTKWIDVFNKFTASADPNLISLETLTEFVFKTLPKLIDNTSTATFKVNPDLNWAKILKNTYVWVKAPFFGDYIMPNVFDQDLTEGSNVVHNNIVISETADFNKYDRTTSEENGNDTTTYPYIPQTGPGIDLLTPAIAAKASVTGLEPNDLSKLTSHTIETIIETGDKVNNNVIGSLRFAPNLRAGALNALPMYFDPEADYNVDMDLVGKASNKRHLPALLPLGGNIYADGRIISPTIDELWVYIKMMTEGRQLDTGVNLSPQEEDMARAYSKSQDRMNIAATTLTIAADNEYRFNIPSVGNKVGDVIGTLVDHTSNENKVLVSKFVNNNDSIKYQIFQALNHVSSIVTKFDLSEDKDRDIKNFTAWKTVDPTRGVLEHNGTASVGDDNNFNIWQPRESAPYSLRELEALIKGNKYNLITLTRFLQENFSVVGPLGYKYYGNETTDSIGTFGFDHPEQGAGSLYQFHREYNFKVNNPNTFFRMNGTGDSLYNENGSKNITTSGMDADFNDLTAPNSISEDNVYLYNQKGVAKVSKLPLLVENYGKSVYLTTEFGSYSGADIYMAADGTWRYKAEHSRVPILRSRY